MISALHLLWITPLVSVITLFMYALLSANPRASQISDAYHRGRQDGLEARFLNNRLFVGNQPFVLDGVKIDGDYFSLHTHREEKVCENTCENS